MKLAKNMYTTAKGERKINCYSCNLSKRIVQQAGITDQDQIKIYVQNKKIIIEKQ